jgi:hypothetical protein
MFLRHTSRPAYEEPEVFNHLGIQNLSVEYRRQIYKFNSGQVEYGIISYRPLCGKLTEDYQTS